MSDQPGAIQDALQPLAPPNATLTLDAPPACSPSRPPRRQDGPGSAGERHTDAGQKVDGYLSALSTTATKSPEYEAKGQRMRTMGDDDIIRAAESSTTSSRAPVKALQEGSLTRQQGRQDPPRVVRRTVGDLDPSQARRGQEGPPDGAVRGQDHRLHFRKYQTAQSHLNGIIHALRNGQDELQRDNVASISRSSSSGTRWGGSSQYVYIAEKLDAPPRSAGGDPRRSDPERAKACVRTSSSMSAKSTRTS